MRESLFLSLAVFWSLVSCLFQPSEAVEHDDIPSRFRKPPLDSLFCNSCSAVVSKLTEALEESDQHFDAVFGYRLDSKGKKIRKNSVALKLMIAMEDVCKDWKRRHVVAQRRDERQYLIPKSEVDEIVAANLKLVETRQSAYDFKYEEEGADSITKADTHFIVRKPKMLDRKSKSHKAVNDMCHVNADIIEHWVSEYEAARKQRKTETDESDVEEDSDTETKKLMDVLNTFCGDEFAFCKAEFFDSSVEKRKAKRHVKERKADGSVEEEEVRDKTFTSLDHVATEDNMKWANKFMKEHDKMDL